MQKKVQNVSNVHTVDDLMDTILERLKGDFERLGLHTKIRPGSDSKKISAYSLQYFDADFDVFVELDDLSSLNPRKDKVMVTFASALSAAHSYAPSAEAMVVTADFKDNRSDGNGNNGNNGKNDDGGANGEETSAHEYLMDAEMRERRKPGGFSERVPFDGSAPGSYGKGGGKRGGSKAVQMRAAALSKDAASRRPVKKRASPEEFGGYFDLSTFKMDLRNGIPFVKLSSQDGTKAHYRVLQSDAKCEKLNWRAPRRNSEKDHFNLCRGVPSFSKRKDATPITDIAEIKGAETASGRFLIRVIFLHRNLDIRCHSETQYKELYVGLTRLHAEALQKSNRPEQKGGRRTSTIISNRASTASGEAEMKSDEGGDPVPTSANARAGVQEEKSSGAGGLRGFWRAITGDQDDDDDDDDDDGEEEGIIDSSDLALVENRRIL